MQVFFTFPVIIFDTCSILNTKEFLFIFSTFGQYLLHVAQT